MVEEATTTAGGETDYASSTIPSAPLTPPPLEWNPPVGGRLAHYKENWMKVTTDQWIIGLVAEGMKLDFSSPPPLTRIPPPSCLPRDKTLRQAVLDQVQVLLHKRVIEEVKDRSSPGFYNRFFVVPKKDPGAWRSILDLSFLNREFMKKSKFKMDTLDQFRELLEIGQHMTSLDLKDAFFHIKVRRAYRKYLRFSLGDNIFQFRVMPMGSSSSPRIFTRLIKVLKGWAQSRGMKIHQYLDDWVVYGARDQVRLQTLQLRQMLMALGFVINQEKSELVPSQTLTYLGCQFNLQEGSVRLSDERWERLQRVINDFNSSSSQSARQWQSLLGVLASAEKLVDMGRLHIRPIQAHLRQHWRPSTGKQSDKIHVPSQVKQALSWWTNPRTILRGVPWREPPHDFRIFTDASTDGWGGNWIETREAFGGDWTTDEKKLHINVLELLAVWNTLKVLQEHFRGKSILVASDNQTTVCYIQKQGGTRSPAMLKYALQLFQWTEAHNIKIKCRHVAGKLNVLADALSRQGQILPTEWSLHPQILTSLWKVWDRPNLDLFATHLNKKMEVFVSPIPDPAAYDVDALSISWKGMYAYAYPPTAILPKVLAKAREDGCELVLIAPKWPQQAWFGPLQDLLIDLPVELPPIKKMLMQPQSDIFHHAPEQLNLHAWRLSSRDTEIEAFRRRLQAEWPELKKLQASTSTTLNGKFFLNGVENVVKIPGRPLLL